jgi:hypothetical protein
MVESVDLKSIQCGFESHREYHHLVNRDYTLNEEQLRHLALEFSFRVHFSSITQLLEHAETIYKWLGGSTIKQITGPK